MRVVSWNVAGRVAALGEQVAAVLSVDPNLVLLQEVTRGTAPAWTDALAGAGLHVIATEPPGPGARRYGVLVAAQGPLRPVEVAVEWPERALGAVVPAPWGEVEAWSAYVPQAANGPVKMRVLEALAGALTRPGDVPRLLGGDLNTPRAESPEGEVTTFSQRRRGAPPLPERGPRWDAAERRILTGLGPGIVDAYRAHHGYGRRERSWVYPSGMGGYRLDHLLRSSTLATTAVGYRHDWREARLSDHSGLVADVVRQDVPRPAREGEVGRG